MPDGEPLGIRIYGRFPSRRATANQQNSTDVRRVTGLQPTLMSRSFIRGSPQFGQGTIVNKEPGFKFIKPLAKLHLDDPSAYLLLMFLCLVADNATGQSYHKCRPVVNRMDATLHECLSRFANSPHGGRVVLIGSINGSRGKFGTSAYSASKAGLLGLAKTVARETGRFGITVNVIEPGWVRTPLTDAVPTEIRQAAVAETILGTLVEPSDIAAAVLFLCGPGGRRITGQVLRVDAGQVLGGGS